MKKSIFYIDNLEQLKALSDPLRVKILHLLIEQPYSGQQLSQLLDTPRQKIHYHIKNLEKNELIYLVEEKKKGNMNEKIYQAVARSFIPSNELLPIEDYYGESGRQMTLAAIDRTRERAIEAPQEAFNDKGNDPKKWMNINSQLEVKTSKEKFRHWVEKYQNLLGEFDEMEEDTDNSEWFYVSTFGFQISHPFFKGTHKNSQVKREDNDD